MSNHELKFRVAEIFGPTIQGEGRNVGMPCHFVRFGGCDYRCSWCDSPHAVLPEEVAKLERLTAQEIMSRIATESADMSPTWVVFSGGNPALLNLSSLIDLLHQREHKVMVETQGSVFREWFGKVDDLCFSPKPPSSGMVWDFALFDSILGRTIQSQLDWAQAQERGTNPLPYLKIPIFTDEDLEFAAQVKHVWGSTLQLFLSIGNNDDSLPTVGNPNPGGGTDVGLTRDIIIENQKHWTERILKDQRFDGVKIFCQQHVIMWGNQRGR